MIATEFAMTRLSERQDRHHALQGEANLQYDLFQAIGRDWRRGQGSRSEVLVALRDVIDEMQIIIAWMHALIGESYAATDP